MLLKNFEEALAKWGQLARNSKTTYDPENENKATKLKSLPCATATSTSRDINEMKWKMKLANDTIAQ